jgi:crotonobetainyl-CoA:carnitine CoA-transferase CaiB-like acyl-CoA transferase
VTTPSECLAGVTVLDFTRILAGPYCTRLLADLGARVIKVERPGRGDDTRFNSRQIDPGRDDQATYFIRLNAGKRSVAVDLAHPAAREVVLDLARAADVVVENFVPGVMARHGLGYRELAAVRPELVYCSISGYGQTGPWRSRPAFAYLVGAVSGLMDLERKGEPEPRVAHLQAADVLAGTHAFGAILAALLRRDRTGQGAYLDVSMLESLIAAEDVAFPALLNGGPDLDVPRPGMLVHQIGDRHVAVQVVGAYDLWARLVELLGRPELARDPRFDTPIKRRDNWPELRPLIVEWLDRFKTPDEAVAALAAARIPSAVVAAPSEVVEEPHLAVREAFPRVAHPGCGSVRVTATPFHLDGRPVPPRGPAPYRSGEHTREVLGEVLGYPAARIEELLRLGAVAAP